MPYAAQRASFTVTNIPLVLVCSEVLLDGTTRGMFTTLFRHGGRAERRQTQET